jgi:hypothetical protein
MKPQPPVKRFTEEEKQALQEKIKKASEGALGLKPTLTKNSTFVLPRRQK